jgi:Methylase involved in ubiquinone/menaquinone biosynthesis
MVQSSKSISGFPETADIETSSEDYARRFSGKIGEYFLKVQTEIILNLLAPWPNARVLDVGGGHAQIAVPLIKHGFDVTVTGSSNECRNRLDMLLENKNSFKFKCCDMLTLPFEKNSFDIVLAFRLLPHVDQWQKLIADMCRVSKKVVIVDYPDVRSFNFISEQLFKVKKSIEGNTRPFRCFNRAEILSEFAKNGFITPLLRPEFFIPMVLHRVVKIVSFSAVLEYLCCLSGLTHFFGSPVVIRMLSSDDGE